MSKKVAVLSVPQRATSTLRLGNASATVAVDVTGAGLLSIAALVSSILLSTAVIVHVATRRRA